MAAVVIGATAYVFVVLAGGGHDEALLLIAITALMASGAHLSIGLTKRPILALSVPLLAGWWLATYATVGPIANLAAAAGLGALAGALLGLSAGGSLARCAGLSLLLAVVVEGFATGLAGEPVALGVTTFPLIAVLVLAVLGLLVGWWAEASLGAALLHRTTAADQGAAAGLRGPRLWAVATALGGSFAGLAGALLAHSGAAPPGVQLGLVLAVAAFAGGAGLLAGTLTLTAALWLLPEMLARTGWVSLDWELLTAALIGAALLAAWAGGGLQERDTDHG
ncbi:MAG: hypothetical protein EA356_11335 [Geminicoccaceae bacterium]|nr:MAG: hypothetical protein EA356_11335 [Geminicoccaceae bacterium]